MFLGPSIKGFNIKVIDEFAGIVPLANKAGVAVLQYKCVCLWAGADERLRWKEQ